ncbi:hypothetical protein HO173_005377 [Letharia columbiana]|uniref:Uncharacterized protein n=1 Tax=Letharia columbiana TaxID=112416 RepID=A0A8H6L5T4_9LECA|nr:uncharacterized protein HO173_005377 [Letharia columbiana]KAF6236596.1 hypothetical protein HO173_005377 [Letharia columbiana]
MGLKIQFYGDTFRVETARKVTQSNFCFEIGAEMDSSNLKKTTAFIRQKSSDLAKAKHSRWTVSKDKLSVTLPLRNLQARIQGKAVRLSWNTTWENYQAFRIDVVADGHPRAISLRHEPLSRDGNIRPIVDAKLPEHIEELKMIEVFITPTSIPSNTIRVFAAAKVLVLFVPIPRILTDKCQHDLPPRKLSLHALLNFPSPE